MTDFSLPATYGDWLAAIKVKAQAARTRAVLAVHAEQVCLYWEIGRSILEKQSTDGWGAKVVRRLADDLRRALPDAKGFSYTNLRYMQRFAMEYPDWAICQQLVGKLPWGHVVTLLDRVSVSDAREWYAREAIAHGWSRNILAIQIETRLFERQGKAISNFALALPEPDSELVQQATKDPYIFDFLGVGQEAHERDIENALTEHITRFLLELKAAAFKPEHAGKLNFYLSAVDAQLKHPADNPTVGMLLCKTKNDVVAEYSLKDVDKPIGIAEYRLTDAIPANLRGSLPTVEELEGALQAADDDGGVLP